MSDEKPLILVVEDQANHRKVLKAFLEAQGWSVELAKDAAEGRAALARRPALVLTDLRMPHGSGLDVLKDSKRKSPATPVIIMTAFGSLSDAVEAMRAGAQDFIPKPLDYDELKRAVAQSLSAGRLEQKEWVMPPASGARPLVGASPAMEKVYALIAKAGPSDASILILGETGTGKELVAAAIHQASARKDKPFVKVHCGAVPEDLLEAELFGHEKGAFTGAVREKAGKFELADGGTLFLDEAGTMSPAMQVKLLRVLQSGEFDRVGGSGTLTADVRVVAATNADLKKAVADGRFREDLYYRLNVVPILLPPLRERREDIPDLALFFLARAAEKNSRPALELEPAALKALQGARWPGNVRQLENAIERMVVLADGLVLKRADIPEEALA
ncbi:MAG: sigma-54-dependent Fis family transcriptional regulator [Elusimicrobia bacterium]|nr:sigma-54-dependent Fis family transcriptional regulator [Elusimicrobiota bacterium]